MKKTVFTFILAVITAFYAPAQTPQAFKYQAVARDNAGNILSNQNVSFRMSIIQGALPGTVVYSETHAVTTNEFGLANLEIGRGTPVSGLFSTIDWSITPCFIKTELDPAGGSSFVVMGTSELLSVPYALSTASTATSFWSKSGNNLYYTLGNIGIGTSTPSTNLVVKSSGSTHGMYVNSSDDQPIFRIRQNSDESGSLYLYDGIGASKVFLSGTGNTYFNGGNVGIGTSSPSTNLVVKSSGTGHGLHVSSTDDQTIFRVRQNSDESGSLYLYDGNGTYNVAMSGSGNSYFNGGYVGIGTSSPSAGLHVKGAQYPGSFIFLESDASQDAGFRLYEGTTDKWHIFNNSGLGGLQIYNTSGQTVFFAQQSTGNVGIGSTNPDVALKVTSGIQFSPGDFGDNRKGTLLLSSSGGTPGLHQYGPALAFSGINTGRRRAAITAIQTSTDSDQLGLAFFTHPGSATPNDEVVQVMVIKHNGFVGIGTTSPESPLDVMGNVIVRDGTTGLVAVELGTGLDYAEGFDVTEMDAVEPGTVLCIDPGNPGKLKISDRPYDCKVAGIVAGANNLGSGISLGSGSHDVKVALAGRVYCRVDASAEAIQAGDLLTTSSLPGYAMKVTDRNGSQGAILGKAMESLARGQKGMILVLVTLQ